MTSFDLQAEALTVLPLRLETITISGGAVTQTSKLDQHNFNNQVGGDCKLSNCDQFNAQANIAKVSQRRVSTVTLKDVIEDNRKLFQSFGGDGKGFSGWN